MLVVLWIVVLTTTVSAERWKRHAIDNQLQGADGIKLADANGDGLPDVCTGWEESGKTRIYLHPGHEKAREPWPFAEAGRTPSVEDAVWTDLDNDGALDLITCTEGSDRKIYFHWQNEATDNIISFEDPVSLPSTRGITRWMYAMPADIDNIHGVDLFVGSKNPGGQIGWIQSPENPRDLKAWNYHKLVAAAWVMSLEPVDLDKDGDVDLVYSDRKGVDSGVFWLENPGNPRKPWPRHSIGFQGARDLMFLSVQRSTTGSTQVLATAKPNVIRLFECGAGPRVRWKLIAERTFSLEKFGTAKAVAMHDFDDDGKPDLVGTCEQADGERSGVYLMKAFEFGSEKLEAIDIGGPEGVKFDRLELLDLDGDGDCDVLTCEEKDGLGVIWYENPGSKEK